MLSEFFTDHPFPRIEFEQSIYRLTLRIHEAVFPRVEPDGRNIEILRNNSCLGCGVSEVRNISEILFMTCCGSETDMAHSILEQVFPGFDQLLVKTIELIETRMH